VVGHINDDYKVKGEQMKKYLTMIKSKMSEKFSIKFVQIPREENEQADRLAKAASVKYTDATSQVLSFIQYSLAIDKVEVQVIPLGIDWTTLIISYLRKGTLPKDHNASHRLKVQSSCFVMMGDVLYKRGFSCPCLRCLIPNKVDYVMKEVHEGICGNHSGARSLVHKLIRAGYYWPIMQKDAQSYVKACDKCQHFSNIIGQPTEELTLISAPWPFT